MQSTPTSIVQLWYSHDTDVRFGCEVPTQSRLWCRSVEEPRCAQHGNHTRVIAGRERQATLMRQGSFGRQKHEYVKPCTFFFFKEKDIENLERRTEQSVQHKDERIKPIPMPPTWREDQSNSCVQLIVFAGFIRSLACTACFKTH